MRASSFFRPHCAIVGLFFLIAPFITLQGQSPHYKKAPGSSFRSEYRIYELESSQVEKLAKEEQSFKELVQGTFDTEKIKAKVPFDTFRKRPPDTGYYLATHLRGKSVEAAIHTVPKLDLAMWPSYDQYYYWVLGIEEQKKVPDDVQLFRKGDQLAYDTTMKLFKGKADEELAPVRAKIDGHSFFFLPKWKLWHEPRSYIYEPESHSPTRGPKPRFTIKERLARSPFTWPFRKFYRLIGGGVRRSFELEQLSYEDRHNGYFALNKPRYKPGDTIRWKAYLLDEKGREMDKKVRLSLSHYRERSILDTVSPVRKGLYYGHFPVPDSLPLDKTYSLLIGSFKDAKDPLRSTEFAYEDRSLPRERFHAKPLYNVQPAWIPIRIPVKAQDANGRPLTGAQGELKVKVVKIEAFYQEAEEVHVPDRLIDRKVTLSGKDTLKVSDSLLPPCQMTLNVEVSMKGPSQRFYDTSFTISIENREPYFKVKDKGSTLRVEAMNREGPVKPKAILERSQSDPYEDHYPKSYTDTVRLPYEWEIEPKDEEYSLKASGQHLTIDPLTNKYSSSDEEKNWYVLEKEIGSGVHGKLTSKKDGKFMILNPRNLRIRYKMLDLDRKKPVKEGVSRKDTILLKNPRGRNPVKLRYKYLWNGEQQEKVIDGGAERFLSNEKLKLQAPKKVRPGEKVKIQLQAKTRERNPIEDLELTAWAFSSQFKKENSSNSSFPYIDEPRTSNSYISDLRSLIRYYDSRTQDFQRKIEARLKMDRSLLESADPNQKELYHLYFPPEGYYERKIPIEQKKPQFAPFVSDSDTLKKILLIHVDGRPVHFHGSDAPYSFRVEPGYHSIRIRTKDRRYQLDSVHFEKGFKKEISIGANNLPARVDTEAVPNHMTEEEVFDLRNTWIRLKGSKRSFSLLQSGTRHFLVEPASQGGADWIGTITRDTATLKIFKPNRVDTRRFLVKPFHSYSLTKPLQKVGRYGLEFRKMKKKELQGVSSKGVRKPGTILYTHQTTRAKLDSLLKAKKKGRASSEESKESSLVDTCSRFHFAPSLKGKSQLLFQVLSGSSDLPDTRLYRISPKGTIQDSLSFRGYKVHVHNLREGRYIAKIVDGCGKILRDTIQLKKGGINYLKWTLESCEKNSSEGVISGSNTRHYGVIEKQQGIHFLVNKTWKVSSPKSYEASLHRNGDMVKKKQNNQGGQFYFEAPDTGTFGVKVIESGLFYQKVHLGTDSTACGIISIAPLVTQDISNMAAAKVSTGGVPAQYGDATGGIVRMEDELSIGEMSIDEDTEFRFGSHQKSSKRRTSHDAMEGEQGQSPFTFRKNTDQEYAYWVPDLKTDEEGKASFTVRFPGRITEWKNFIRGRKEDGTSFRSSFSIHALKQQELQSYMPRFLRVGDSSSFSAKARNFGDSSMSVHTSFHLGQKTLWEESHRLDSIHSYDPPLPSGEKADTLQLKTLLKEKDGRSLDGALKELPVISPKRYRKSGQLFSLGKENSTLTLSDSLAKGRYTLEWHHTPISLYEEKLKGLKDYPHACNEQAASKLKGLIAWEKWQDSSVASNMTEGLIEQLVEAQNEDGGWGWWASSSSSTFFTAYVWNSLKRAEGMGYEVDPSSLERGKDRLLQLLTEKELSDPQQLKALTVLAEQEVQVDLRSSLGKIARPELSSTDRYRYDYIAAKTGAENLIPRILEESERSMQGGRFWPSSDRGLFHTTSMSSTLWAYKAIKAAKGEHPALEGVHQHLLYSLQKGNSWNTYETALVLGTIAPDLEKGPEEGGDPVKIRVSGSLDSTLTKDQKKIHWESEGAGQLQAKIYGKLRGPSFLMFHREVPVSESHEEGSKLSISTSFEKEEKESQGIREGDAVDLKAKVRAEAHSQHVMIEVPVPAGMEYADRPQGQNPHGTHWEYYKESCFIFCEELPKGTYSFSIPLSARFEGDYIVPPASAKLMYFPVVNGYGKKKQVRIRGEE